LTVGLSSPLVGKLTDLYGPKNVVLAGAAAAACVFALLSRIDALWQFYGLYFLLGLSFAACGGVPVNTAISGWFTKRRGLAVGIAMAGVSLGAFVITPAGAYIMGGFGWRATYLFLAVVTFALAVPPVVFLMKDTPQEVGLLPEGVDGPVDAAGLNNGKAGTAGAVAGPEWTLGMASKTGAFWMIAAAFFLIYFGIGAVLQHQINFLGDMGISLTAAAVALGVTGGIGGFGKISFGLICDMFSTKSVTVFCFTLQALGIILLLFAKSMAMVWIFVVVFGFAMGGQLCLQPLIVGHFFGLRSFGTIYGVILMAGAIGTATGPILAALAYAAAGSYYGAFAGCVATSLLASALISASRRPAQG
jgi:MFS family permease